MGSVLYCWKIFPRDLEEAQSYLKRIRYNTDKMSGLINDILDLSRLSRAELKMTIVDLGMLGDRGDTNTSRGWPRT